MKLSLTAEQLLKLHDLLSREKNVFDDRDVDVEDLRDLLRSKILSSLEREELVANSKVFKTWEKKEEERIQELEGELSSIREQLSDMNPSPSKPGILRPKKKNKF